jgi:hypothetical protein
METLDLSAFFQTKAQANDFSARLSLISEKIYNTNFNLEKMLTDQFGIKKKDAFMSLMRQNKIDVKTNSVLKTFFSSITESIATLPILSLTLAFEPKEKTLQKLSEWFVLNINRQAVFDISVDPELIGGASISFKGKHMDFSIRPTFDEILNDILNPKSKIIEIKETSLHQEADHLSI